MLIDFSFFSDYKLASKTCRILRDARDFFRNSLHFDSFCLDVSINVPQCKPTASYPCKKLINFLFFQVHLLNIGMLVLLVFAVLIRNETFRFIIAKLITLISGVFIIMLMLWELKNVHKIARGAWREPELCRGEINVSFGFIRKYVAHWFALKDGKHIFGTVAPYFAFMAGVTIFHAIKLRQKMKRQKEGKFQKTPEVCFEGITRENADESFSKLIKYLVNYGFYNFGKELTLFMLVLVIFKRVNWFALFYTMWLVLLIPRRRKESKILWNIAALSIALSILIQCAILALFVLMKSCFEPTRDGEGIVMFLYYFFLKHFQSFHDEPSLLTYDFILLTFMSCQVSNQQVLKKNNKNKIFSAQSLSNATGSSAKRFQ